MKTILATKNECYIANKNNTRPIRGIVLHSTGCNNPYLSRYVQPIGYTGADMALLGENKYKNDWCNNARPGGTQICCHGFIGYTKDKASVDFIQILPFEISDWNSGAGSNGRAWAQGYVEIEICEDGLIDPVYFFKVYNAAVSVCAGICRQYGVSPEKPFLIDHSEAHTLGIASAHGDVAHWFPKFGKSMNTFRADVKAAINANVAATAFVPYDVNIIRVTAATLNIRKGAGTNFDVTGVIRKGECYTIVDERVGTGAKKWGKLKSGAGWISLDYTVKA